MNFEEHYGELTGEITLNGTTPDGNSMPINKCFLGKKFQKQLKKFEMPRLFIQENVMRTRWRRQ